MSIISAVGAGTKDFEEKNQTIDSSKTYRIYFGVFFDGTSNNMIQGSVARTFRRNHKKRSSNIKDKFGNFFSNSFGEGRHKYEYEPTTTEEATKIDDIIKEGSFKRGYYNWKHEQKKYHGKDGGFSNVSILFSKYIGAESGKITENNKEVINLVYKIYVEGSGANDIKQWNTGIGVRGLGFGVGKTGVVALVSKAIMAVHTRLIPFRNNSVELKFDIFGFSRGAACARLFAYMVSRKKDDTLPREAEFRKYYCKSLFEKDKKKDKKRLPFLDDYENVNPVDKTEENIVGQHRTKEVCFLGIFDTVASIGMLRRKSNIDLMAVRKKILLDLQKQAIQVIKESFELTEKITQHIRLVNDAVRLTEENFIKGLDTIVQTEEEAIQFYYDCIQKVFNNLDKKFELKNKLKNHFLSSANVINPLRVFFFLDKDFNENLHDLNVAEYGMFSPQLGIPTFHICAMDEFRENFALTDIGKNVPDNCLELFLPGCHSDIGGGYLCNNEEKITLNKYPTFSFEGKFWGTIQEDRSDSRAYMFVENPQCINGTVEPLSLETLYELGWFPKPTNSNSNESQEKEMSQGEDKDKLLFRGYRHKYKVKTSIKDNNSSDLELEGIVNRVDGDNGIYEFKESDRKVWWTRKVPSFFSNVTLHLMAEKASKVTGRMLFIDETKAIEDQTNNSFWPEKYYMIPKGLKIYYNKVRELLNNSGCRKWVFPGESYSSDDYKRIRQNYLHFTSEQKFGVSRTWDVQNGSFFRGKNNVICRIIYHGDKEDAGNMHFMYDYNGFRVDSIESDPFNSKTLLC